VALLGDAHVSRTGDRRATRRTATRCAPFPRPAAVLDPAASFGAAIALDASGDIACLPANERTTCVMTYVSPSRQQCVRAASVPLARPARAVALGAPVCDQTAARRNLTIGPLASTSAGQP
jgi:hypothetical protein